MNIPILRLGYSKQDINYIKNCIAEVLESGYITMGKKVKQFEKMFADFVIDNSGSLSNTRKQVKSIFGRINN